MLTLRRSLRILPGLAAAAGAASLAVGVWPAAADVNPGAGNYQDAWITMPNGWVHAVFEVWSGSGYPADASGEPAPNATPWVCVDLQLSAVAAWEQGCGPVSYRQDPGMATSSIQGSITAYYFDPTSNTVRPSTVTLDMTGTGTGTPGLSPQQSGNCLRTYEGREASFTGTITSTTAGSWPDSSWFGRMDMFQGETPGIC